MLLASQTCVFGCCCPKGQRDPIQGPWPAGEHLVATQAAPEQKETIGRALTQLLGSNGVTAALDRVNRRRLRSNLCVFVGTVRDVVRTR